MRTVLLLAGVFSLSAPAFAQNTGWGGASWVWDEPDANKTPQNNEPRYLRLSFTLADKLAQAELWVTADNLYTAYVNGQKVGEGASWAKAERYDIAKHLVAGKNVLAIKATNQGGVAGAIARLHIKTADKKDRFIVTDAKTRITQKADKNWLNADFDDSSWFAAIVLGDPSIGPWNLTGGSVANASGSLGKGPKAYGSTTVDPKVTKRLSAKDQLKHFIVPKDFEIELVAADPIIINPITMVVDDKGRIIVSESHTYRFGPPGSPIKPFANPVVRLDPDGKGGFTRTLVADGFDDPVMGIAVKGNKLWLTANNYLYQYDLPAEGKGAFLPSPPGRGAGGEGAGQKDLPSKKTSPEGKTPSPPTPLPKGEGSKKGIATNKRTILQDKTKAWNPFGMFVLEWGPDSMLYMSVGNHNINIEGPDGKMSARGGSGLIMRMNPDGTKMERLVHGLRVPYSFDMDPFGQLWLLSNGEGNPDRFVRVIEGVDYHCYSRGNVDNNWLAGNHPLAPPCEEVHGGAHTQFMRYYAAAYPQEFQGNLFACNWGRHGFAGANRGIFRFILDDRNNVAKKETLVACTDPHFRPSHIHIDVDGSLLIADWYGRDDESDMTGRIWRLKYVGKNAPVVKHKLDSPEWKNDDYAIEALGSPHHLIREKAMRELANRDAAPLKKLGDHAANAAEPLGAANAIWVLMGKTGANAKSSIAEGIKNPDWRVRRLTLNVARRLGFVQNELTPMLTILQKKDRKEFPAVWIESVPLIDAVYKNREITESNAVSVIELSGAAADPHLRYEAAVNLAKCASLLTFTTLLASDDADVRLAALIAIDVACYENFDTKKIALAALAKALENPGKLDHQLLLMVAQLDGDASIVPALEKLIARDDLPTATIAKAVLVLKAKSGGSLASSKLSAAAGKRLIEAVEKGSLKIASPADQLVIFEFLESEGPTPFALKQIEGQLRSNNKDLKQAAHTLARRFGPKASPLVAGLWPSVLNPKTKFEDTLEYLSSIARTQEKPNLANWKKLLESGDPFVRAETVRWWRVFNGREDFLDVLNATESDLVKKDVSISEDITIVRRQLQNKTVGLVDKASFAKLALNDLAKMPAPERSKRAAMGLQVFERNACTKCHTTATATTLLAPSLKGVSQQKVEYLIESVLFPSKIIKTGWEVEQVELKNGKTLIGLVKDEGKHLRVLALDKDERILKSDVESRATSKVSVMPDGQEATLSRREFVDLIAYLQTLK